MTLSICDEMEVFLVEWLVRSNFHAYTAGASLFRPIVKKNSEISWKQSSKTLSTAHVKD